MSDRASNSSNRAPASSSGSSNVSSVREIARPGTSSGPRTGTANSPNDAVPNFYAMEPPGVDDSVQRPPSSTSVPSYHSNNRPPTYHSQQASSGGASQRSNNSGPPPSYHSTDPIVSAPRPGSRGQGSQGSRQQAQPQAQPPPQQQQQQPPPQQQEEETSSGRIRRAIRGFLPRRGGSNQGSGSGRRR